MFMIKNVSKTEIEINDLHISIQPNRSVDLDMICSRQSAIQSLNLRAAISKGIIKIVRKDGVEFLPKDKSASEIQKDMHDLEKRLTEKMNAQISKHIKSGTEQQSNIDINGLTSAVEQLNNIAKQLGSVQQVQQKQPSEEPSDMTNDKIVDIHQRAIGRMSKNVQGNIKHEETKSKSDVKKNIDELENLL